jgi:hypothetical protein
MLTKNNVESNKNKIAKEDLKQLAEKDKDDLQFDLDGDINQNIINLFKEEGKPGESIIDFIKRTPVEKLIKIMFRNGGAVDFSGYSIADIKAIFRSENGYDAKTPRELLRGVKMYLKNLDIDGIPFGTFGKGDK